MEKIQMRNFYNKIQDSVTNLMFITNIERKADKDTTIDIRMG